MTSDDLDKLRKLYGHLRVTHFDSKFGVARLKNDDHNLAEDEPVFVFRAGDRVLPYVLWSYAKRCQEEGSPPEHIERIQEAFQDVTDWQTANPDKVKQPD